LRRCADVIGIDVVGEGVPLPFTLVKGSYTLNEEVVVPSIPTIPETPAVLVAPQVIDAIDDVVIYQAPICVCEDWEEWQWDLNEDCGQGGCDSIQLLQTRERECEPLNCEVSVENRCVADSYCATMIPVESSSQTASAIGAIGSMGILGWVILGIVLLLLIFFVYFYSGKKRR
jgi:hypothetical protein